jgi:hypothetical protein
MTARKKRTVKKDAVARLAQKNQRTEQRVGGPTGPIGNPNNPAGAAIPVEPPGNPPQHEGPTVNEASPIIHPEHVEGADA